MNAFTASNHWCTELCHVISVMSVLGFWWTFVGSPPSVKFHFWLLNSCTVHHTLECDFVLSAVVYFDEKWRVSSNVSATWSGHKEIMKLNGMCYLCGLCDDLQVLCLLQIGLFRKRCVCVLGYIYIYIYIL